MARKSLDQTFNSDWQKAVVFAQMHGLKANDILPIYQQDAQRVQNNGFPMSVAERNRALLAAKNPNNVTPVPSDNPSPKSLLGNTRTNLASIFTGLAPNHLIPNIAHSVENAVLHPSSWLHPLEEVGRGVLSANPKEIGAGLEQAASPNSILNWIPGVYDLGLLAKGGLNELLTQPVTAFLDIAPFAPAGRVLSLAADDARIGVMASRLGMSVEQFKGASIPQMGLAWTLMRPLTKITGEGADAEIVNAFPGAGRLTKGMMTDDKGRPLTISGLLSHWSQTTGGLTKMAASIGAASMKAQTLGTDAEMYVMVPAARAMHDLSDEQVKEVEGLIHSGRNAYDVMHDDSIDPKIRDAYEKTKDVLNVDESQSLASGKIVMVRGPKDSVEAYSVSGQPAPVAGAAADLRQELVNTVKVVGPANEIHKQMMALDKAQSDLVATLEKQRQVAQKAPIQGHTAPVVTDFTRRGTPKSTISLSLSRQRDLLMRDDGLIGRIGDSLSSYEDEKGGWHNPDPETALGLTRAALRDLEKEGFGQIQHTADPSLDAVFGTLQRLETYLKVRVRKERQFTDHLLGMRKTLKAEQRAATKATKPLTREDIEDPVKAAERHQEALARSAAKRERSKIAEQLNRLAAAQHKFSNLWWRHPSDAWRSVVYDGMIDRIIGIQNTDHKVGQLTDSLKDMNYSARQIERHQSDPKVIAEAIWHETRLAASDPAGTPILDEYDIESIYNSGINHANTLRAQGKTVQWVPVVSSKNISRYDPGRYGVGLARSVRDLSSTKKRSMTEFMPERYDLLAAVHLATKEAIQRANTVEFVEENLAPHAKMAGEVARWAKTAFPDEYAGRSTDIRSESDLREEHVKTLGLVPWNPNQKLGYSLPRWGNNLVYLPAGLAKAVDSLLSHHEFPMDGAYDRATNLFRFSILGLSPRFTAHIVFGGAFLLALRSDPSIVTKMGEGWRLANDPTKLPVELRQVSAERGIEPAEYRTVALEQANRAGGAQLAYMHAQEHLAASGIDWRKANPVQWLKALGEVNYRFTRRVSTMYRAASYLDHAEKVEKAGGMFTDPVTGQRVAMTRERAIDEGIHHALKVMGDLRNMSPLERSTFMRIMPFYGWTRHILSYVLSYPVDHPYRAQFLAVQAQLDSDSVAKALDTRILFMFFMGKPDDKGNVQGVDLRFLDPLRDTANYASWAGWIGALNPVIEAPLAAIDPNLVYGTTSLYPSVTYNEFYGIETSTPQGNPLEAVAKGFVPQVGVLDAAITLAGNHRSLATKNPNQFYKTIFESLNIPFAQVQSLNVKQLAAKGEMARFRVAKTAAANAWAQPGMGGSGITDALAGYASVPNPMNPDYEITPQQLQEIYNAALAAYPGQNPADVVTAPPTPSPAYTP